jgi:Tol biopolymer transport system component
MTAKGTKPVRLTDNGAATDAGPSFSPDGRRIAFHTNRDGDFEIYAMSAGGTEQVNLSDNPAADFSPVWQPIR